MFRKVVVGISGGVDSAVSALLLKEKGFKVLGVFMKNWDELDERGHCTGEQELLDAEYTCNKLGIELQQVNYVKDYWNKVFTNFLEDYEQGFTPNPDMLCNRYIKFDLFYKHAIDNLKYDAIATGHYACTSFGSYLENYNTQKEVQLLIPKDTFKDQTFFLAAVQRDTLRRTMFPLANLKKTEVKDIAKRSGLARLAHKKESTGICFVGNRSFQRFINEYIKQCPGHFVDIDTAKIVGEHQGIHQWTVGQRCRLSSFKQPYFVAEKHVDTNTIYVAAGTAHPALYNDCILATQVNWLCAPPLTSSTDLLHCRFRFQHTKPLVECRVYCDELQPSEKVVIVLEKPLRAITPGQFAVFYKDNVCLGSARIIKATSSHSLSGKILENNQKTHNISF